MPTPCLHIIQTRLSQARTEQLLNTLSAIDIVVFVHRQDDLLAALSKASFATCYELTGDISGPAQQSYAGLATIVYTEFVALIASCAQSRTW